MFADLIEEVEKYVFGYPAGKSRMKVGLAKMITPHKTYVEPFCGSAAVFFHKEASENEVLNDMNSEVMDAFRAIQTLSKAEASKLLEMNWVGSRERFKTLFKAKPTGKLEKLHRFLYLAAHSYGLLRRSWNPGNDGKKTGIAQRAVDSQKRLKGVTLCCQDYAEVVRKYDASDTFFFFDPPYPGYDVHIGETSFDELQMRKVLKGIKGRFILTYGVKGKADFGGFNVQRVAQYRSISTMRGVNRDKVLMTLVVTNYKGAVYKAFEDTDFEVIEPKLIVDMAKAQPVAKMTDGGMHAHFLDRAKKETGLDGTHSHVFMIEEDGKKPRFLHTMYDGPHQHKLKAEDSDATEGGGEHTHKVQVWEGMDTYLEPSKVYDTSSEAGHTHELSVARSAYDGTHRHELAIDGKKLKSVSPGQLAAMRMQKSEMDPYAEVPMAAGIRPAVLKARFVTGGHMALDLWLDNGNHMLGWSFDVAKRGVELEKAAEVADRFSVNGDRFFAPITTPVPVQELGVIDHGIAKLDGPIEDGYVAHVDSCLFEHGLHTEHSHEYFLSKGSELVGVLDVIRNQYGEWEGRLRKSDLVPAVLSRRAQLEKWLPPHGISGLPQSLEELVPDDLRYWTKKDAHALEARDMLVASGFISKNRLALVGGEIRMVEQQLMLYEPSKQEALPGAWALKEMAKRYGGPVTEQFGVGDTASSADVSFCDLSGSEADEIAKAVEVAASGGEFAIVCADSDQARAALRKHGRPFRLVPEHPEHAAEVCKRIFLASFPLLNIHGVEWLDKVDQAVPYPVDSDAVQEELTKSVEELLVPHTEMIQLIKTEEERFVMGIVLEPETKDSQGDVISEEDIRKAAHEFMAEYQNVGLMHRKIVNGKVDILECYLAPVEFSVGKQKVKKGTWLLGTRVKDDKLWDSVKRGELTGYSIGGDGVRRPE